MPRMIAAFAIFAVCVFVAADTASAKLSLRSSDSVDDLAPVPQPVLPNDAGLAPIPAGAEAGDSASGEGYILHCCPPPRGYTPIKCDPNAYNCFRAMRSPSRFPYRFRSSR